MNRFTMSKTAEQSERYVTYGEFRHEIDRPDRRIEVVVGAAEDRLIGKMAAVCKVAPARQIPYNNSVVNSVAGI